MAKRKTKRSRKNDSWWARLRGGIDMEACRKPMQGLGKLLLVLGVLAGVVGGLRFLEGYIRKEVIPSRGVKLTVEFTDPPQWASQELIEHVCLASGVNSDDTLLDKNVVREWAKRLIGNPWIKQLRQIQRSYDGRVVIDCELRRPVAVVQQQSRVFFVDLDGVVLPYYPVHEHLVEIQGEMSGLPRPGQCIRSASLLAGIGVLALVREVDEQMPAGQRIWGKLARLDVSNYEGRLDQGASHLKLFTRNQTEIRWGAAVGREQPYYEAPARLKLESLYRAYMKYGSLDRYKYVELRNLRKEKTDPLRMG